MNSNNFIKKFFLILLMIGVIGIVGFFDPFFMFLIGTVMFLFYLRIRSKVNKVREDGKYVKAKIVRLEQLRNIDPASRLGKYQDGNIFYNITLLAGGKEYINQTLPKKYLSGRKVGGTITMKSLSDKELFFLNENKKASWISAKLNSE